MNMDHIGRIGIFLEVVKRQSFSGAARQLGMTGPAISKQIRALEDQLGVRLLNRTTRQVSLTEAGALYQDRARKALEDLAEAEQQIHDLKDNPTGPLRVNAPMSFGQMYMVKPIAEFARQYPNVRMDVTFDDRNIDMVAEGYDVVVRIGALKDSSLIARQIAACPLYLVASPQFLQQHGVPETPEDISTLPAAVTSHHGTVTEWHWRGSNGQEGSTSFMPTFIGNTTRLLAEAALSGLGFCSLPVFAIADELRSGRLVRLLPDYTTIPERHIYAMFPQNRYLSTKTRLFVDSLTVFGRTLPWTDQTTSP